MSIRSIALNSRKLAGRRTTLRSCRSSNRLRSIEMKINKQSDCRGGQASSAPIQRWALRRDGRIRGRASGVGRGRGCRQALAVHAVSRPGYGPRDYPAGAAPVVGDGRFSRKRAPHRSAPWARGRRARVCDHPELGVDAPSAPACIRERSRALPVCEYLRQARQTTLGENGVVKLAECNLEGIKAQCTVFMSPSAASSLERVLRI